MKNVNDNIRDLDNRIGELLDTYDISKDETERLELREEVEHLSDIRAKLHSSKVEGSNSALWVSGGLSIVSIILIMKFEQTDVITTKAFNTAMRLFRN